MNRLGFISREEILKVAYDLKLLPLDEIQISYVQVFYNGKAEEDPTGYWELWVEQLLYECIGDDKEFTDRLINSLIDSVFLYLKNDYINNSEVTSGEYILSVKIPTTFNDLEINDGILYLGLNKFLEWDNCETRFTFKVEGNFWVMGKELDIVYYNNIVYPVRIFTVTHSDSPYQHNYMVAPKSLNDAMIELEGEYATTNGGEAEDVDMNIYHYVEDNIFYEDAKYICEHCLDIPMKLISE